jgi:hypothetical protein
MCRLHKIILELTKLIPLNWLILLRYASKGSGKAETSYYAAMD